MMRFIHYFALIWQKILSVLLRAIQDDDVEWQDRRNARGHKKPQGSAKYHG